LVEPFAGGGIISLTALFENYVDRALMVELDDDVAAVWKCVINNRNNWLANRITGFDLTVKNVLEALKKNTKSVKKRAFQTILKNRTFHGGILANGSGLIKYGENGKGIRSRWYPQTLSKRFFNLNTIADRIDFRQDDGVKVLQDYSSEKGIIFFIDPPYTAGGKRAGSRLYKHFDIDHEKLFKICSKLKGDFLITYDNSEEVKKMARQYNFDIRSIAMRNTHLNNMKELVIGRDLSWMH
jgi:DNA adenine methylase